MTDVECFNNALKLTWIRRLVLDMCHDVSHLMQSFLKKPFAIGFGDDYFPTLSHEVDNPFWKEVFLALSMLSRAERNNWLENPLWKNSNIQIGHKSVFYRSWYEKGIICVKDLIDNRGNLLNQEECEKKFDIKLNYFAYYSIPHVIRCRYNKNIEKCDKNLPDPLMPSHKHTCA